MLQSVTVCCSVSQSIAECCSVLRCVVVCSSVLPLNQLACTEARSPANDSWHTCKCILSHEYIMSHVSVRNITYIHESYFILSVRLITDVIDSCQTYWYSCQWIVEYINVHASTHSSANVNNYTWATTHTHTRVHTQTHARARTQSHTHTYTKFDVHTTIAHKFIQYRY